MKHVDTFIPPFTSERRAQNIRNAQAQAQWSDDACGEVVKALEEAVLGQPREEEIRLIIASVADDTRQLCDLALRHVQLAISFQAAINIRDSLSRDSTIETRVSRACVDPLENECRTLRRAIGMSLDRLRMYCFPASDMDNAIDEAEQVINGAEADYRRSATIALRDYGDVEAVRTLDASAFPHKE